jgi:hypothetical protein
MYQKLMCAMVVSLLAAGGTAIQAATFTDDFAAAHDYVKDGLTGTGWDGFLGTGDGETVDALNASGDRAGQLYIASTNGWWQEPFNPLPPMLYKTVTGDFVATVKVTDYAGTSAAPVYHNNACLIARATPLDAAGAGEDWVSIDYFPIWSCGNFVRSADDDARTENGNNGRAFNLYPWLQLERVGNVFHMRVSADGVTWTEMASSPLTRTDFDGVAVQIGLSQCTYSTTQGYAAFDDFTLTGPSVVPAGKAYNPSPTSGATDVVRDATLSWTPNALAVKGDVYFGASQADVTAATTANPLGVLVAQGQDANTFDPAGLLEYGQTYYWRIDGIDAAGAIIAPGEIWSFTATASSSQTGKGPDQTINGSGLTGDTHGVDTKTMWISANNGPTPVWIQYAFDKVYKMNEMWVWNYNSEFESVISFGPKDVTIQYSANGTDWTTLGDFVFEQGLGTDDYAHNTVIPLGGISAKQIKIIMKSGWSGRPTYGLSEVRFFYIPVWAREPKPATASTNIDPTVTLSWRAGREAASHNVYIGTDSAAVTNGQVAAKASNTTSLTPSGLELGATYYWKVEEVNAAQTPSSWSSDVWSFSTLGFLTVDDMESYNDVATTRIFDSWVDGWGTTSNGAQVGYATAPFAEQAIIHGGRQSMPFAYNNAGAITASEATLTLAGNGDWTRGGAKTLVLFFRGTAGNATSQLYVKINGTKVNYPGDAAILATTLWKQWNIDLASVGNVTAVKTLTIGITGAGAGTLYFDDIRLYKSAPAVVTPVNPGTTGLMAYFPMEGDVKDASGHSFTGTLNNVTFGDSMTGFGKAAQFNGTTSYVDMGTTISSGLLKNLTSCTFAVWVNYPATANAYGRVFDFGVSSSSSFVYLAAQGGTRAPRFGIRTATVTERTATGPRTAAAGWHHVAAVIDASTATPTMSVYLDGDAGTTANSIAPKDMGETANNWLGRSQFTADPYFNGGLDEFRIYNRALSAAEIHYLAGDR